MQKINFTKMQNIARWEAKDFRDDGTFFKMFLYKGVIPFSYATWNGMVFVDIRLDYVGMKYDVYKDFKERDEFNGVDREEFDAIRFLNNLEAAYNFYKENN